MNRPLSGFSHLCKAISLTLIAILSACGSPSEAPTSTAEYAILDINHYPFLFNETDEGGVINFTSSDLQKCSLTFIKKTFLADLRASINKLGSGNFDITCLTEEDYFSMSAIKETHANLEVTQKGKALIIHLDFVLYSVSSKEFLKKTDIALTLTAKQSSLL